MPQKRKGRIDRHGRGWRFQVFIDGERIRKSFPTYEEAQAALDVLLAEAERDEGAALRERIGPLTVGQLVHLYLERRRTELEASTMSRYDNVVAKHILPGIGHFAARDVASTPILLADWLKTVPPGSARKALEVLGPAFQLALDNGLVATNPVKKLRRPPALSRRMKKEIPTPEEVEKMVITAYEEDVWWGYYVELTATLGTRRSETCALRWEDFEFPDRPGDLGRVTIRRSIGKRNGGIYIKPPKSGFPRELYVDGSLFLGLDYFSDATGWLFPGRDVRPRDSDEVTASSSPGRLLLWLDGCGGFVESSSGTAGAEARRAIGTNSATFSHIVRELLEKGLIERTANARRTFRIALTDKGASLANELADADEPDLPWHPDTASHRFEKMVEQLGLRAPNGRPYTLHSLRHFRATHLYNQTKDWVQVAKYLGHTTPVITMELYANNVVSETQVELARAAVRL